MKREEWNYEIELKHDRRVERWLLKEFFVFLIVLAVLAIRIFLG